MQTKEGQADIGIAVLSRFTGLVDEKTGVTDGFIIAVRIERRAESFYLKEVECPEDLGDIFGNRQIRQLFNQKQINSEAFFSKRIFG